MKAISNVENSSSNINSRIKELMDRTILGQESEIEEINKNRIATENVYMNLEKKSELISDLHVKTQDVTVKALEESNKKLMNMAKISLFMSFACLSGIIYLAIR